MQQVLFPEVLDLNAEDSALLLQMSEQLHDAGFEITQIARNSFSVDGIPAELGNHNALQVLLDILHSAAETVADTRQQWEHKIALLLADTAAIPAGKELKETEMRDLIARLQMLDGKEYSVSGKRIMALLPNADILKLFK